jgi:CHAD domain-containing protein
MLQGVEDGDVDALHRTRVASRRLREVLPVLRLDPEVTRKLNRRLRKITDRLGSVREYDVLLGVLDELKKVGRYPKAALPRVAAHIGDNRAHARERLLGKVRMGELRRVAAKLEKVARTLENNTDNRVTARHSWRWAIDARVARRASTLGGAIADAGAVYLAERLHLVRIAVKKLRYALELAADADHVKTSPDLKQLRRTQDILGRLHDLQVLVDRAREVQGSHGSLTPPDLNARRELDVLIVALEEDCRHLHGRYMQDREALLALCARLSRPVAAAKEIRIPNAKVRRISNA